MRQLRGNWLIVFILVAMVGVSPSVMLAQTPSGGCAAADSPSDLSLELSLQHGQTVFRKGEIIAMDAKYSSPSKDKYRAGTRSYDRSGRLSGEEIFCVDPVAGTDPLADYFSGVIGFVGGGLGSDFELGKEPYVVHLELNEWKSLPPGSYRLRVIGHRVGVVTEKNRDGFGGKPISVQSNEVMFQVTEADAGWQAQQLASAVQMLDSASPTSDEAKHAARVLRFLGSEASTRELARRFWGGNDQPFGWDWKFGLFGSPHRSIAIEAMKAALVGPRHPVTEDFIQTLAILELQSDPANKAPVYIGKTDEVWKKARETYNEALDKKIAEYRSELAQAVPSKTGAASAVSAEEVLQSELRLTPAAKAALRQMLADSWGELTVPRQNELIGYRWDQIGGPELLPVLRRIAGGEAHSNRDYNQLDRGAAMRRIYELAPGEGRELILREIADPHGDVGINVLGLLPDKELPQIEAALIERLQYRFAGDRPLDFALAGRYASALALPALRKIYEARQGDWACAPQSAMLNYFLRVSPEYGATLVSDALGARKRTGCYKAVLMSLKDRIRNPELEKIAIGALDDPDPAVAREAINVLKTYGAANAEAALWERLEKFHKQWKDARLDADDGRGLEQSLVQAITSGQAWCVDSAAVFRLRELTTPPMQPELDSISEELERGEYGLTVFWAPEGTLNYGIGRYNGAGMDRLKEKLGQFPVGTHLTWMTSTAQRESHVAEFAEVERAAEASGWDLKVQMAPQK